MQVYGDTHKKTTMSQKAKNGQDSLLGYIDSFREKAKKLQSLIDERQRKVDELDGLVEEKESKNKFLQAQLDHKQKAAEVVLDDIRIQFESVQDKLDQSIKHLEQQMSEMTDTLSEKKDDSESLGELKEALSEKIHSENVRMYRNLQDYMRENDGKFEIISSITAQLQNVKRKSSAAVVIGIINLILLVVNLLNSFGII